MNGNLSWRHESTKRDCRWLQQGVRGQYMPSFIVHCGECIITQKSSCRGCVQPFEFKVHMLLALRGWKCSKRTKLSSWIHSVLLQMHGKNCLLRARLKQSSLLFSKLSSCGEYHIPVSPHLWVLGAQLWETPAQDVPPGHRHRGMTRLHAPIQAGTPLLLLV